MRVAIAGATGFLGTAIARALVARGDVAIPLPRAPNATDAIYVDALVWAAGTRDVESPTGRAAHVDDLVAAVDRLHPRRVIYLSTGEVYGDGPVPFRESSLLAGSSSYALAKLDGEAALRGIAASIPDLVAVALRIAVAYGPAQRPTMLIPQLLRALRAGEPIALSAGDQTRDFVHVDDVTRAVVAALQASSLPPAINVGTGIETQVCDLCREVVRLVARATSRSGAELLGLLQFGQRARRVGEPWRSAIAIDLAGRALDWHPQVALSVGLATTIDITNAVAEPR
jgi:UDP-glucose 4-epimerase